MEKTMTTFPEIKGLTWVMNDDPSLVVVNVTLVSKKKQDLGIEGMDLGEFLTDQYVDFSKLTMVRNWYPDGSEENQPSKIECLAHFSGVDEGIVLTIPRKNLIEAWMFYKRYTK